MLAKVKEQNDSSLFWAFKTRDSWLEGRQEAKAQRACHRIINPNRAPLPCLTWSGPLSTVRQDLHLRLVVLLPSQPTPTPLPAQPSAQPIVPVQPQAVFHRGPQAFRRGMGPLIGGRPAWQPSALAPKPADPRPALSQRGAGEMGPGLSQASWISSLPRLSSPPPAPAPVETIAEELEQHRVARLRCKREQDKERKRDRAVGLTPPPAGQEQPSQHDRSPRRTSPKVEGELESLYKPINLDEIPSSALHQANK
jgi:hypothetical protein